MQCMLKVNREEKSLDTLALSGFEPVIVNVNFPNQPLLVSIMLEELILIFFFFLSSLICFFLEVLNRGYTQK